MTTTVSTTLHGFPRQGRDRELKRAIEDYWSGGRSAEALLEAAAQVRRQRRDMMRGAGVGDQPSNDFSLYDQVLDTAVMVGAVPERHRQAVPDDSTAGGRLDRYFALARGTGTVAPLEMTKWFDTNYHYLVPEIDPTTPFVLDPSKPLDEFAEALAEGVMTRPVLVGPVTFLRLSRAADGAPAEFEPLHRLEDLVDLYVDLLGSLADAGVPWVQVDEPALVTDLTADELRQAEQAHRRLAEAQNRPRILLASYFGPLGSALDLLVELPVEGLAIDLSSVAGDTLERLVALGGVGDKRLVAGVVDGRNVWATDLESTLARLRRLEPLAGQIDVAPSCSLLHVPLDLSRESDLDPQVRSWLAFGREKLREIVTLARGLAEGDEAIAPELKDSAARRDSRTASRLVHSDTVRARVAAVTDSDLRRASTHDVRRTVQHERLALPMLPTTTIGSFPQTSSVRRARADLRAGRMSPEQYDAAMRAEIDAIIVEQERLGLDVLVHGEPERNDMVQYFAEQLDGFVSTRHGWVQSYGTRYVRPPIIVGDVTRPAPMTVRWARYAQDRTARPLKGMLTGPVTMLAWSFVRDDQPHANTARQVALALRDEVTDLEAAGIGVIQVDEPALRETLPLRRADRDAYLTWAVDAFRLATSGVRDETQIHTHMCYADFGDVLDAIIAMDADVISLEAARSHMTIVADLARAGYPNDLGPGVWDIHSPRIPGTQEVAERIRAATRAVPAERLWVNPDCGLKTRGYEEVRASLRHLVAAARDVRASLQHSRG